MPKTKEQAEEQMAKPESLYKIKATFYKRSRKLDKGSKKGSHALCSMKKMLKNLISHHHVARLLLVVMLLLVVQLKENQPR